MAGIKRCGAYWGRIVAGTAHLCAAWRVVIMRLIAGICAQFAVRSKPCPESDCGGMCHNSAQLQRNCGFVRGEFATLACGIDLLQKNICFSHGSCHRRATVSPQSPAAVVSRDRRHSGGRDKKSNCAETCPKGQVWTQCLRQPAGNSLTVSKRATTVPGAGIASRGVSLCIRAFFRR